MIYLKIIWETAKIYRVPRIVKILNNKKHVSSYIQFLNHAKHISVQIKSLTWTRDSHGLFDYESKNVNKNTFKLGNSSIFYHKPY